MSKTPRNKNSGEAQAETPAETPAAQAADTATEEVDYDRLLYRCPIAWPISSDKPKMTKKLYSLVKKAVTANKKRGIIKGIKEVTKAVRRGAKGVAIIGADVSPYDVISHMPVLLEEKEVPYIWVPSRQDLGASTQCKRPTTIVLLKPSAETQESYSKIVAAIAELNNAGADTAAAAE